MDYLIYHCSQTFTQYESVLLTLFLAGLVGGFTHCAGMCGPFVATQTFNKFENLDLKDSTILSRLQGSALIPYHLGRMTTYVILGVIASLLSKQIIGSPVERLIAATLLIFAGVIFIATATPYLKSVLKIFRSKAIESLAKNLSRIAKPLMKNPTGINGYGLGVMLGFIPCGLIFAALMVVATISDPITAGMGMVLFTLGTFPALFLVGFSSQFAYSRWPLTFRKFASFAMLFNAFILFKLAGDLVF